MKLTLREWLDERLLNCARLGGNDPEWQEDAAYFGRAIAAVDAAQGAIPAMREYARRNPIHHFGDTPQDPNGVHAWLGANDSGCAYPHCDCDGPAVDGGCAAISENERLRRALHDIVEEWAGAECGEPVHAQEAYAIGLAKRMYTLAAEALRPNVF